MTATAVLRPTAARINLAALRHNLACVRRLAGARDVVAVIKADAYGHGATTVARALAAEGVSRFGVAIVEEGRALREAGLRGEILVLGGFAPEQAADIVELGLTAVVVQTAAATALNDAARRAGRIAPVHVKIDTGMGRLGFVAGEAAEAVVAVAGFASLRVEGLMTHFADADLADPAYAREQIARFDRVGHDLAGRGITVPIRHAANSAILLSSQARSDAVAASSGLERALYDAVRPGIMLYGCRPGPGVGSGIDLRPVLSLTTRIGVLRRVPRGTPISYGRTFTTSRESLIAVLPVGYADGYRRSLSNAGTVLVRGRRAPVVGRVCMDATMADVTEVPGVAEGDDVVLIGTQGGATISAEEVAATAGTIAYEILCGIGPRVPRRYDDGAA